MTRMETPVLNDPQRRHYAVLLAMLEDALREIEALAAGTAPAGRLTPMTSDISAEAAKAITRECGGLRERVYALADVVGASAQPASAVRRAYAALISSVIHLEDSTAKKLAAYGPVDPSVKRLLDPPIRELHDRLSALAAQVNPAGRSA